MYFCPKCNYSFDITKASLTSDNRKKLHNVTNVLKRLNAKKKLSNYVATFDKKELTTNKNYKKLSNKEKKRLEVLFESPSFDGVVFKCLNCNYIKKIKETIRLYQLNLIDDDVMYKSIADNKLIIMNPILPRTKDYTCKNINCITHKDKQNKEAVYYKDKNSYDLTYVCTVCFNSWTLY